MYRVEVLGPFRMTDGDGCVVAFEARSAAAVVALLTLAKGHALTRNDVASTLWPDQDEATARTNLRKAIQRVRKATLDQPPLESDGDFLSLAARQVQTDLEEAERLHRTFLLAAREDEGVE